MTQNQKPKNPIGEQIANHLKRLATSLSRHPGDRTETVEIRFFTEHEDGSVALNQTYATIPITLGAFAAVAAMKGIVLEVLRRTETSEAGRALQDKIIEDCDRQLKGLTDMVERHRQAKALKQV